MGLVVKMGELRFYIGWGIAIAVLTVAPAIGTYYYVLSQIPEKRAAEALRIESVARELLKKEPALVKAALEAARLKEKAAQTERAEKEISARVEELSGLSSDPSFGADRDAARITIVEFYDYRCGFCRRATPKVLRLVREVPGLRVVAKEFPILGDSSTLAARFSLGAWLSEPGRHREIHEALMRISEPYSREQIVAEMKKLGIDGSSIFARAAMDNSEIERTIGRNRALAEAIGVRSTPTWIIGGKLYMGDMPYETLKSLIEREFGKLSANQ